MSASDDNISPYLRRPIRTYEQFLREQAERTRGANQVDSSTKTSQRNLVRKSADDVEPRS